MDDDDYEEHDALRLLGEQVMHYEHEKSACRLKLACALQFVRAAPRRRTASPARSAHADSCLACFFVVWSSC